MSIDVHDKPTTSAGLIALLEHAVVPHRAFKSTVDEIIDCIEQGDSREYPKGLAVIGPPGVGKTLIAKVCEELASSKYGVADNALPVINVEIPANVGIRSFAQSLAIMLGGYVPKRATEPEYRDEVVNLAKLRKVRGIIFNEVNHFAETARTTRAKTANWFKSLMDTSRIPMILMGTSSVSALFEVDQQLPTRFLAPIRLEYYSVATEEGRLEFAAVCQAYKQYLPGRCDVLDSADDLLRIYFACHGIHRRLVGILVEASRFAVAELSKEITREHLSRGFRKEVWRFPAAKRDPFLNDFNFLPLVGIGEPFHGD